MSPQLIVFIVVTAIFVVLGVGGILYLYMLHASSLCNTNSNVVRYGDVVRIQTAKTVLEDVLYVQGSTTTISTSDSPVNTTPLRLTPDATNQFTRFIIRPVSNDLSNRDVVQQTDKVLFQLEANQSFYIRYAYENVGQSFGNTQIQQWMDVLPKSYDGTSDQDTDKSFKFRMVQCPSSIVSSPTASDITNWFNACTMPTQPLEYQSRFVLASTSFLYVDLTNPTEIQNLVSSVDNLDGQMNISNIQWQFEKV